MARVLVVEDDRVLADLIRQILEIRQHTVVSVYDGTAAVETGMAGPFDLILMDIMLPGRNGFEAARAIGAAPDADSAGTPIIAMSAALNLRQETDDWPFVDVLAKPFDIDELVQVVARHARRG